MGGGGVGLNKILHQKNTSYCSEPFLTPKTLHRNVLLKGRGGGGGMTPLSAPACDI